MYANQGTRTRFQNFASAMRRGYVLALLILALLAIGNFVLMEWLMRVQTRHFQLTQPAVQIQEGLHKIRQTLPLIFNDADERARNLQLAAKAQRQLHLLTGQLRVSLDKLNKAAVIEQQGYPGSLDLESLLSGEAHQLRLQLEVLIEKLRAVSTLDLETLYWRFSVWAPVQLEVSSSSPLTRNVSHLIDELYLQSSRFSERLSMLHNSLIIITLAALLAEALLIFRPLMQRLAKANQLALQGLERMRAAATTDVLTGLGNRRALELRFKQLRQEPSSRYWTVLLIDLVHFKNVNDVHGHAAGDHVLKETARRLEKWNNQRGSPLRTGGDEFAIIIDEANGNSLNEVQVLELSDLLREPIAHVKQQYYVGAAIGIATSTPDAPLTDTQLLHRADLALRTARGPANAQSIQFFTPSAERAALRAQQLAGELALAIANCDLVPYYQPLFDIDTNRLRGVEALIRWHHPDGSVTAPDEFMPVIAEYGLMTTLTESLLTQVAKDRHRCLREGFNPGLIAINFADPLIADRNMPNMVAEFLGTRDLRWLQVEIVETAILHRSIEIVQQNMRDLQAMGAQVALDDFGTGHASLSHLRSFPCNTIKIDHSFIDDLLTDQSAQLIVRGVIAMVRGLGLKVVIEGIESEAHRNFFKSWPTMHGQGYLYSKPIPINQLISTFGQTIERAEAVDFALDSDHS